MPVSLTSRIFLWTQDPLPLISQCSNIDTYTEDQDEVSTLLILRTLEASSTLWVLRYLGAIHLVCFVKTWFCQDGFNSFC